MCFSQTKTTNAWRVLFRNRYYSLYVVYVLTVWHTIFSVMSGRLRPYYNFSYSEKPSNNAPTIYNTIKLFPTVSCVEYDRAPRGLGGYYGNTTTRMECIKWRACVCVKPICRVKIWMVNLWLHYRWIGNNMFKGIRSNLKVSFETYYWQEKNVYKGPFWIYYNIILILFLGWIKPHFFFPWPISRYRIFLPNSIVTWK